MPLTVICSGCSVRLTLDDYRVGTTFACPNPKCGRPVSIPTPVASNAPGSHPDLLLLGEAETPLRIQFRCPSCHKVYKADTDDAGKRMVCKNLACGAIVTIPGGGVPVSHFGVLPPAKGDAKVEKPPEASEAGEESARKPAGRPTPPPLPALVPAPAPRSGAGSSPRLHLPTIPIPALPPEPSGEPPPSASFWRDPVKLALSVTGFCGCCMLLFLSFLIVALTRPSPPTAVVIFAVVMCVLSLISASCAVKLFTAKHRAIAAKGQPVSLLFGLAQLISWEQNEGLILLRDKRIAELIYGPRDGGGLRILYPILGEELKAQVPLTLQLTWFSDERVLTRESIQLVVKVAIWWEVTDLEAYFYRIDQEVHALKNRGTPGDGVAVRARLNDRGRLGIAEVWVETMAESCLRKLISDTSTFLIISKRAAGYLNVESGHARVGDAQHFDDLTPATPDVLAEQLREELRPRLGGYGLRIDRVEVQEIQLPKGIQKAVDEVWVASTLPTKSQHEAEAQRNRLKVLVELLGQDNAALREIVGHMPDGALLSNNPIAAVVAQLGALKPPTVPSAAAVNVMFPALVPPPSPVPPPAHGP